MLFAYAPECGIPVRAEDCAAVINNAFSTALGEKVGYAVVDSYRGRLYSVVKVRFLHLSKAQFASLRKIQKR